MPKWPWIDRHFSFDFPVSKFPDILERFRGLPVRAEDRVRGLTRDQLTRNDGKGWSIQENLGHLLALESLFDARLDDYAAGKPELRAADMETLATKQANYNAREIGEILRELRTARLAQTARLEKLSESDFALTALHPRLKIPMRQIDAVCFVCEHDDYHMARIAELRQGMGV